MNCILRSFSPGKLIALVGVFWMTISGQALWAQDAFRRGVESYEAGEYDRAAAIFRQAAEHEPSGGLLQNLGNAEWKSGRAGAGILAWERAQWLEPFNATVREDLRFARKARLLSAPDLVWYEICSTWLPVDAWAWLACISFWLAVTMILLPWVFRWRRAGWHQALAAAGFAVFLLTLPALLGVHTRAKLGVIIQRDAALRLTPTAEAQNISRLPEGETGRLEKQRGQYLFIRTSNGAGWIERSQFALIAEQASTAAPLK